MHWSRYVALLMIVVGVRVSVIACPPGVCVCKWKNGKQTVECGNRRLATFPDGLDTNTQVLNFSGNSLTALPAEWFYATGLLNLQKIFLARNQLMRIDARAFRGLSNLVELDLAENALTAVPTDTFADYPSLMRLALNGNAIRELKTASFKHLSFLTTLELSNCQIETVERDAFIGLDNLEWLRLDGNRIGTVHGPHLLPDSLHGISLHGNRWRCDCALRDLHQWLATSTVPQTEEPKCAQPTRLAGSMTKTVSRDDLACVPELQPKRLYMEIAEGRNVTLSCRVQATPEATVTWWFQGRALQNQTTVLATNAYLVVMASMTDIQDEILLASNRISMASDRKQLQQTDLFVSNTTTDTNGTYMCVAENAAGRAQANYTVRVIVKEEPVVEQVTFPVEYYLVFMAGGAGVTIIVLVIVCIVICRCCCAGRRRRGHNGGGSSNSDSASMNGGSGTGANGGGSGNKKVSKTTSSMMTNNYDLANGGGGGANIMTGGCGGDKVPGHKLAVIVNDLDQDQQQHIISGLHKANGSINYGKPEMLIYGQLAPAAGANGEPLLGHEALLCHNAAALMQCSQQSQPATTGNSPSRNYSSPDPINPDLINDTENRLMLVADSAEQQQQLMQLPRNPQPALLVGTLPRNARLMASGGHHQVDVHLNPGCFLQQQQQLLPPTSTSTSTVELPLEYNMMAINRPSAAANYAYRTLPHRMKIGRSTGSGNTVRFARDAEFMTSPLALQPHQQHHQQHHQLQQQPHSFELYTPSNIRYTAEGYPYTTAVPYVAAALPVTGSLGTATTIATTTQKVVSFQDQAVQFLPSPPDGYKSNAGACVESHQHHHQPQPSHLQQHHQLNHNHHHQQQQQQQQQQQPFQHWPPCLPSGYRPQTIPPPPVQSSQIVPIKTQFTQSQHSYQQQQQRLMASPLPSPVSSIASSSSSSTKVSASTTTTSSTNNYSHGNQTTSGAGRGVGCGGSGSSGGSSSSNSMTNTPQMRCVGAQTVNIGGLNHRKSNVILEEAGELDEDARGDGAGGITGGAVVVGGDGNCGDGGQEADDERGKMRHLNGPLADSPDEGYVGDSSHDGGSSE